MPSRKDLVLDLLFPPKCPFCGCLLEKGLLLCPECRRDLPWLGGAAERGVELTAGCWSPLRYEGAVRKAVHDYKFHGQRARSKPFGALVAQCVADNRLEFDLVSWPSLSKGRLRERGYDQAQLLACEVALAAGRPLSRTLDKAERPAQSGQAGIEARRVNLLGAYTPCCPEEVRGKTVLLVDDVITTGATLSECAKTLRVAGAKAVVCATLARA